jgi:hypothetical protein
VTKGAFRWVDEEGWDGIIPFFMMFDSVSKGWNKEYFTEMLYKLIPKNLVDEFILVR